MMMKNHEIIRLKDGNGNLVEVLKRPLEIGDSCVILLPKSHKTPDTVLYRVPTGEAVVFTIKAFNHEHVHFHNMGSWHRDFVYQYVG